MAQYAMCAKAELRIPGQRAGSHATECVAWWAVAPDGNAHGQENTDRGYPCEIDVMHNAHPQQPLTETLGIYVQIPFCASKCTFCNFSSRVAPATQLESYVSAVEREAELAASSSTAEHPGAELGRMIVDTVYLGGGTPTLLGADKLERIFHALRANFDLRALTELTVELTPGSASSELLDALRRMGVNRLSIGAQSFDDRELRTTGRLHSAADTVAQVHLARAAGFRSINLDLIAGLPYQSNESWKHSLETLAKIGPEHASIYLFEADEKSRLGRDLLRESTRGHAAFIPDDDFMARAYESASEFLGQHGYEHYEISNFARPGFASEHNRRYWRRRPYLGLGAGAHSFGGGWRWSNETEPVNYEARLERGELPIAEKRQLDAAAEMEEFFFLGLRERDGVNLDHAERRWASPPLNGWIAASERLKKQGLLVQENGRLRLAERGYLVSNEIFVEFLS